MKTQQVTKEGRRQLSSTIQDMVRDMDKLGNATGKTRDEIRERIQRKAYGINVTKHYTITLAGGGPAMWVEGKLDEYGEPATALLLYTNWFEWPQTIPLTTKQEQTLLQFARLFYFGE